MKYKAKELTPEQKLGQASEFVSTKGLVDEMLLGIDSPAYYATQVLEASVLENKGNKSNVFDEIEADLLLKDGEEEPVELTEKEANEKYEEFSIEIMCDVRGKGKWRLCTWMTVNIPLPSFR